MVSQPVRYSYEFGPFRLDTARRCLLRGEERIALSGKAVDLLIVLIENCGQVVDKDELMARLWPDTNVEEANLTVHVSALRKALGEGAGDRRYIATASGRGYSFVAGVETVFEAPARRVAISETADQQPRLQSMAVLPFTPVGLEGGDEYLALGLADALITRLSSLRQVVLRPTSAVRSYADQQANSVIEVGRSLRVDAVLEGTIRRFGERVRVTVQLVDVADGRPIWAEKFDESFTDILSIEDKISAQVASALASTLTPEEKQRLARRHTENPAAYQLYLEGRIHAGSWTADGFAKAIDCYEEAVQHDPGYALAHCGWAEALALMWSHGFLPTHAAVPQVRILIARALKADPNLAEAHGCLGLLLAGHDWRFAEAEQAFEHAIALAPNNAGIRDSYALYFKAMGRHEEAIAENQRALALDPLSAWHRATLAWAYYFAGSNREALEHSRRALEAGPDFGIAHWTIGLVYLAMSEYGEAVAALETAARLTRSPHILASLGYAYAVCGRRDDAERVTASLRPPAGYLAPFQIAIVCAGLGRQDEALDWLETAAKERETLLIYAKVYPLLESLRDSPRFRRLLQKIGLDVEPGENPAGSRGGAP